MIDLIAWLLWAPADLGLAAKRHEFSTCRELPSRTLFLPCSVMRQVRLHHKRSEWSPDGVDRRTVYVDDQQLCQLTGSANGAWSFPIDWAGLDGVCTSSTLKGAEDAIRALHGAFGVTPRYR